MREKKKKNTRNRQGGTMKISSLSEVYASFITFALFETNCTLENRLIIGRHVALITNGSYKISIILTILPLRKMQDVTLALDLAIEWSRAHRRVSCVVYTEDAIVSNVKWV